MKISIIIPTFNRIEYVEQTLDSLSFVADKEVIVIDDCSSEGNSLYIKQMCEERGFEFYKNTKNLGLSETRNRGLKKAKGDYVFFLDSDDLVTKEFSEWINKNALSDPIYRFELRWLSNGKKVGYPTSFKRVSKMDYFNISQISSFLFNRTKLIDSGVVFKGRFVEDKIFLADLISARQTFREKIIKIPSIHYRTDNESLMRSEISFAKIQEFIDHADPKNAIQFFVYVATLKELLGGRDAHDLEVPIIPFAKKAALFVKAPLYFKFVIFAFLLKY